MIKHYDVPKELDIHEISKNDFSFSPAMYRKIIISNKNVKKVEELLLINNPYNKGIEPGSNNYLENTTHYMVRTKALKEFTNLLYNKGEAIIGINPKSYKGITLKEGDILLSKDSNVGECAIVDKRFSCNYTISSGIVKLNIRAGYNKLYVYSFLKHSIFKEQLLAMTPRGSTITHAGSKWMQCLVPFPDGEKAEEIINKVSLIMQLIIDKEAQIYSNDELIFSLIDSELKSNQKEKSFEYREPQIKEIFEIGRLDGAIYCSEYKKKKFLVENYAYGYMTPSTTGFTVTPGPSLEIKIIKTRIDSDIYIPGFYELYLPTNISEYGTMTKIPFIGTKKELPMLKKGDVLFGEAGFQKGRSVVIFEEKIKATTNAHGLYARHEENDIWESVFFRCVFDWYRKNGLIDLMGVGGSGGHFSPEYFENIFIPSFNVNIKDKICKLYYSGTQVGSVEEMTKNGIKNEKSKNNKLGIYELNYEIECLKNILNDIQEEIIRGVI